MSIQHLICINAALTVTFPFLKTVLENPKKKKILTQCFHCVDFLILVRDRRSAYHRQQSLISTGGVCFVELHCLMKCVIEAVNTAHLLRGYRTHEKLLYPSVQILFFFLCLSLDIFKTVNDSF